MTKSRNSNAAIRILIVISLSVKLTNAEYYIKNGHSTSYLYKKISEYESEKNQFLLKLTLNKMEGTLLHMIDKYGKLLIISFSDYINETIKIKFRGEDKNLTLSEFCGCLPCKYKLINLTITINGFLAVQCNQMLTKMITYSHDFKIKGYSVSKTFNKFQVPTFLVITPTHNHSYNTQLSGCIFEIIFNGQPLDMTINGDEITRKCPIKCIKNVCNLGVCYETFSIDPICDCTDTFYNGKYCNSSGIEVMNSDWGNYPLTVQLRFIKITWRADSSHICGIENKNISVTIQTEGNYLYILYKEKMKFYSNKTISGKYHPNQNAHLYLSIDTKVIKIKFLQNNNTEITETFVSKDLSKEHFISISVPKRSQFIDFVYKSNQSEYKWRSPRVKFIVTNDESVIANVSKDHHAAKNVWEIVNIYIYNTNNDN